MMALDLQSPEFAARAAPAQGRGLRLAELCRLLDSVSPRLVGDSRVVASGLQQDSRRVTPGDIFAARAGARADGTRFVKDAVRRGAVALLVERGAELGDPALPTIEVSDIRLGLALAAEALYGHPSREIEIVGITGTNGKTTTSWLAVQAIDGAGGRAARLGTLGFAFGNDSVEGSLTTPAADDVSRYARDVKRTGGSHLVMEVSSHALSQARVDALCFRVAAFTNLTQDHLDYHGTMDEYAEAKARLFTELSPKVAVINVDDAFGKRLAERCPGAVLRVGRHEADVQPLRVELRAQGISAQVLVPGGVVELESQLVGGHNLDNLLMALAIASALDLDPIAAARALSRVRAVPGRLERCDVPADDITVLVDYAHTPDALERVLGAVRGFTEGRVTCVFGCGGDRDAAKRPQMGEVVGRAADRAIVTNDNPRSEEPEVIARAIEAGLCRHGAPYVVELDRARAIERAIVEASSGDVVLIAGKGHEPYQILGAETRRFDDRVEARRALALRRERLGR